MFGHDVLFADWVFVVVTDLGFDSCLNRLALSFWVVTWF